MPAKCLTLNYSYIFVKRFQAERHGEYRPVEKDLASRKNDYLVYDY